MKYLEQKAILEGVENAWVKGYHLEKVNTPFGWLGSSGQRRARTLAQKGLIESRIKDKYVEYRYKTRI